MFKSILFTSFLASCLLFSHLIYSQETKVENEKRVKKEEFPRNSLNLIDEVLTDSKRERYFKESDGESTFYEYKSYYNGKSYSIKFNSDGYLVDIEVLIDFKDISNTLQSKILSYLEEEYKKHNIKRFQIQYLKKADSNVLDIRFARELLQGDYKNANINFELEVEVLYENDTSNLMECLFDGEGVLIKKRKVNRRDEDYILY